MKISDRIKGFTVKQMYSYLGKDPDANIPKLLDYLVKYDKDGTGLTEQAEGIRRAISDPDNNWYKLAKSLWTDIDAAQRKALVESAVVNGSLIGTPETTRRQDKYQCNVPWAILMDPPPPATCTAPAAGRPNTATS